MDIFCEQIIKRRPSGKNVAILVGSSIGAIIILLLVMSLPVLMLVSPLILVGLCAGLYYIITSMDWEFEYSITNDDFTCDKIIHRRKRKRQFAVGLRDVEEIGKYDPQKFAGRNFDATCQVSETANGIDDAWYMTGRFQKYGNTLIVFSPDARILNAIKPSLKHSVDTSAFPAAPEKE